ncbi:cytochrome c oxidase subunit II [Mechercharimyces sp. CAU 1602]|nr:cytochrome c oxidase subunit II [Mechercharimyces sp. CAU 1602]
MIRRRSWFKLPLIFGLLMLVLSGCSDIDTLSTLKPAGPDAKEQLNMMYLSLGIMVIVVAIVFAIFTYVLLKYRRKPGQTEIPKQVEGNHKLEIIWTVIPIILLAILAVPTVSSIFNLAEKPAEGEDVINIRVTGHQYWWEFEYTDLDIRTSQDLYIPVGKEVQLELTSDDVIHAFWVPSLAGKQDATPGKITPLRIEAERAGTFQGKCAELCGASHALMDFNVVATEEGEFDEWVANMQNPESEPQTELAEQGKELFSQSCMGCHAVRGTDFKTEGMSAPDLTGFGERSSIAGVLDHDEEALKEWLEDPEAVKPETIMPGFDHFTDEQMDAMSEYLLNLK